MLELCRADLKSSLLYGHAFSAPARCDVLSCRPTKTTTMDTRDY